MSYSELEMVLEKETRVVTINDIMEPLVRTAEKFIAGLLGLSLHEADHTELQVVFELPILKATSYINIVGAVPGRFFMSMDERLLKNVVQQFVMDELTDEQVLEYMEDTLAECLNIILGNSIKLFPIQEEQVIMETPIIIGDGQYRSEPGNQLIWTMRIRFNAFGTASLSFITTAA